MKLDRRYLMKVITEAMGESVFDKLMRLIATDYEHAKQAMDLVDFVELSPEEDEQINQAYVSAIVMGSDSPGRDLKEFGYDFHQVFIDVYGFPPPMDKEFTVWGAQSGPNIKEVLSLRTTVYGEAPDVAQRVGHDVEFEFWWDMQSYDYDLEQEILMEPWFRFETMHGKDGYVVFEKGVIRIDEDEEYSEEISKEQLPSAVRSAMGLPWDADISGWPELPKGQPPAEGSDIEPPVDPPYEGKRKLNKNYLFEVINEVLQEEEDESFSAEEAKRVEEMIRSNEPTVFLQGLELHSMGNLGHLSVPYVVDSYVREGGHYDYIYMGVENEEEAWSLKDFLHRMRTESCTRPAQDKRGAKIYVYTLRQADAMGLEMNLEEGNYVVEILLDMPPCNEPPARKKFWGSIKEDDEEEEFDTSMIDDLLKSDDEEFIDQAADLVDTLEGIIPDEKFEKYVSAIADHYVYGNKNLKAIEWLSRNYNVTIEDISGPDYKEELFAVTPENPENLKALRNDMDVFWQWDNAIDDKENKRLIVGELATTYRSFNHLMEKNFGATPPAGQLPRVTWGDNLEVSVQNDSTNNNVVRFIAGGNYRPRIEIVNPDAMSGRNPEAAWWAYNIQSLYTGNLQIRDRATSGVISHTFGDGEDVNYSIDEMKEKIKELTGIDLNAIN